MKKYFIDILRLYLAIFIISICSFFVFANVQWPSNNPNWEKNSWIYKENFDKIFNECWDWEALVWFSIVDWIICKLIPCWIDKYRDTDWVCKDVWIWYYSPNYDNLKYNCNNHPDTASRDYTYTSDWNGSNH